jgi:3-phosphoshikimate 1-carboxyvinyltransferase
MSSLADPLPIRPVKGPLDAVVGIPGSKSLTNRALVLAALSEGTTELHGALWAEDTRVMVDCLRKLGFEVGERPDHLNADNRILTVRGHGGEIPAREAELFVGTAGTAARFLSALCALGKGPYRLGGTPRMHERPMREVFDALRELGADVKDTEGRLPAEIRGPIKAGKVCVTVEDSSQFASALLLVGKTAKVEVDCPPSPYVELTRGLLGSWSWKGGPFAIEPDASSASYFFALQHLLGGKLTIPRWPPTSLQVDHRFLKSLPPPIRVSRKTDLGDAVLTLVIVAAALRRPLHLTQAGNLRKQECDRLAALATELGKCGVPVREEPEGLVLAPAKAFRPAEIETYRDHRIAMCFAVLGSVDVFGDGCPWISIRNPSCVEKTFPSFFETLGVATSTVR